MGKLATDAQERDIEAQPLLNGARTPSLLQPSKTFDGIEKRIHDAGSKIQDSARSFAHSFLKRVAERAEKNRRSTPLPGVALKMRSLTELDLTIKLAVEQKDRPQAEPGMRVDTSEDIFDEEYQTDIFMFIPRNLAAAELNFYEDIVRTISLKPAARSLADLAAVEGREDRLFMDLRANMDVLKDIVVSPLDRREEETKLCTQLTNEIRLLGCLYREALRGEAKLQKELLAAVVSERTLPALNKWPPDPDPLRPPQHARFGEGGHGHGQSAGEGMMGPGRPSRPGHRRNASVPNAKLGPLSRVSVPLAFYRDDSMGAGAANGSSDTPEALQSEASVVALAASQFANDGSGSGPKVLSGGAWTPPLPSGTSGPGYGTPGGAREQSGNGGAAPQSDRPRVSSFAPPQPPPAIDEWLGELVVLVEGFAGLIEAALNRALGLAPLMAATWVPGEVRETWRLCEEFILAQSEDTLLAYMASLEAAVPKMGYPPSVRAALCEPFVNLCMLLKRTRQQRGYVLSLAADDQATAELFASRLHRLKANLLAVLNVEHSPTRPSAFLNDLIGGGVAALAMTVALLFSYWGQMTLGLTTYDKAFMMLVIGAYILKDRIKVWGQRYYAFVMKKFGVMTPDHTLELTDLNGRKLGAVMEECRQMASANAPEGVLRLRHGRVHHDSQIMYGRLVRERVLSYCKLIRLSWEGRSVSEVSGVSDRTRIDISSFLRRAEDPTESHWCLVDREPDPPPPGPVQNQLDQTSFPAGQTHVPLPGTDTDTAVAAGQGAAPSVAGGITPPPASRPPTGHKGSPAPPFSPFAEHGHGNGGQSLSLGRTAALLASEFVTARKVECPRTYECILVVKVRRKIKLIEQLEGTVADSLVSAIRNIVGSGQRGLRRALSHVPIAGSIGTLGTGAKAYNVEIHKVYRVILDKNGIRRIEQVSEEGLAGLASTMNESRDE